MHTHPITTRACRHHGLFLAMSMALAQLGCAATVTYSASVAPTRLVEVSPGVWVVYDYPEAIFYTDDAYWWWNGGTWYRSRYADDGWVVVRTAPPPLRHIRPRGYVYYRGHARMRPVPNQHVRGTYVAVQPAPRVVVQPDGSRGRGRPAPPPTRYERDDRGRSRAAPAPNHHGARAQPRDDGRGRGPTVQPSGRRQQGDRHDRGGPAREQSRGRR